MSFRDTMRRIMKRARDEASDVAQVASLKLDIRNLEGKREHLLKEIGRTVCASSDSTWRPAGVDPLCTEVASVERKIASLQQDLKNLRGRPARPAEAPANAPST